MSAAPTKSFFSFTAILIFLIAVFLGLAGYTFYYARGYSYLLDDPNACINCHVMNDFHRAWTVSSHRDVTCNGCHVPEDFFGKYLTKIEHGMRHSYVFTFQDPQIFRLKESGKQIVEQNCINCHAKMVDPILPEHVNDNRCLFCHQGVAHGKLK